MIRIVLFLILSVIVARAFWRLVDGLIEGLTGKLSGSGTPVRGVQMVRDPVCGTYVVRDSAVAITDGRRQLFFCSIGCRDKYRARTA